MIEDQFPSPFEIQRPDGDVISTGIAWVEPRPPADEWGVADVSGPGNEPGSVFVPLGPPLTNDERAALEQPPLEELDWTKMTRHGSKSIPPPMLSLPVRLAWRWRRWRAGVRGADQSGPDGCH